MVKYKVGDKVLLANRPERISEAKYHQYLGKVVTVERIANYGHSIHYYMQESGRTWYWFEDEIVCKVVGNRLIK